MQRSFDDLGTPLHDVTFVVVDLETTGASPATCEITEVGAVKLRGGECLGTFQTLVNPRAPIPPAITFLTGITESMVLPAPLVEEVLPSFVEFAGDAVLVGHNVRFDLRFLDAALVRSERPRLANRWIDTAALARRLVRDEVPDCRLGTLAARLRLSHRPTHRALDDALATGDLLHLLLERAGRLGVTGLDDLLALPKLAGHPQVAKLRLTDRLPRSPGIYVFRDRTGRPLYIGKATNLRTRVRSYFSGDDRRMTGPLLRQAHRVDHQVCATPLEAAVREVRLIQAHLPRYNRHLTGAARYVYLKVTDEPYPRLSVARSPNGRHLALLGPLPSTRAARTVAEAIETAVPIRRCAQDPRRAARDAPCTPAQLGVSFCPCAGPVAGYRERAVAPVLAALDGDPELLLAPLRRRLEVLARAQRYEEAAAVRDRARALARALRRRQRFDALRAAGDVVVEARDGGALIRRGALVQAWAPGDTRPVQQSLGFGPDPGEVVPDVPPAGPIPASVVDELSVVAAWLDAVAGTATLVSASGPWAWPTRPVPGFDPARRRAATEQVA